MLTPVNRRDRKSLSSGWRTGGKYTGLPLYAWAGRASQREPWVVPECDGASPVPWPTDRRRARTGQGHVRPV